MASYSKSEMISQDVIVIGGSAGSFRLVTSILSKLPLGFKTPIVLVLHRSRKVTVGTVEVLQNCTPIPVKEIEDKMPCLGGTIYLCPSNYHVAMERGATFSLSNEEKVNASRPSIDITMCSMADALNSRCIGFLLSGANKDGAVGLSYINKRNGKTFVQDPLEAIIPVMPKEALKLFPEHQIVSLNKIIHTIIGPNRLNIIPI